MRNGVSKSTDQRLKAKFGGRNARDISEARPHGPAMKKTLLVVVLILGVAGSRAMAFDTATEEAKLLRRDAEWADLATKGKEIDKIVSYWTDDAVIIMPGQPIVEGKAAIRAYVASSLSNRVFN